MATVRKDASERVTTYLESLPSWSKNICQRLREIILQADASIEEDWKWGPHYSSNGMVCGWSAFQKHVKVTFFNGSAINDEKGLFNHCMDNEFSRSVKYTAAEEMDAALLTDYIRQSVAINQKGYKRAIKNKAVTVPEDLDAALAQNKTAAAFFNGLSYGYKKDFVELVTTAKQEKTRQQRIAKVVEHCAAGKRLHDKYKAVKS